MADAEDLVRQLGLDPSNPEVMEDIERLKAGEVAEQVDLSRPNDHRSPILEPKGKTNRLAVVALICSCLLWLGPVSGILGMVFGGSAKREVRESQGAEWGIGMAEAAQMLGLLNFLLSCLGIAVLIAQLTK
jgi:hypothetical protein